MKRLSLAIFAVLAASNLLAAAPARADAADAYVFGTRLVLTSPRQLADPNTGWWAEMLPMEYNYATGTIVKAVNAARAARGVTETIDMKTYPISLGGELAADKGFEYNIDFARMTPEDVAVILAGFPMTGVLSDLTQEVRPIGTGYFYANGMEPGAGVKLEILGKSLSFSDADSYSTAHARIATVLAEHFGDRAKFDLSFSRYSNVFGTGSFDINVTVYIDGAESGAGYGGGMEGEGGH